jgi:hypothetical protein
LHLWDWIPGMLLLYIDKILLLWTILYNLFCKLIYYFSKVLVLYLLELPVIIWYIIII